MMGTTYSLLSLALTTHDRLKRPFVTSTSSQYAAVSDCTPARPTTQPLPHSASLLPPSLAPHLTPPRSHLPAFDFSCAIVVAGARVPLTPARVDHATRTTTTSFTSEAGRSFEVHYRDEKRGSVEDADAQARCEYLVRLFVDGVK